MGIVKQIKGVWIDRSIMAIKDLSFLKKGFLGEVDNLGRVDGCFASNGHFSEVFGLKKNRCGEIINELVNDGYLTKSFEVDGYNNERRILSLNPIIENSNPPSISRIPPSSSRVPYKDEITIYITTTTGSPKQIGFSKEKAIDELMSNQMYVESILKNNKLKNIDTLQTAADRFVSFQIGLAKVYNNLGDFKTHFSSWCKSQGLVDVLMSQDDLDASFGWFMETFNKLSRKQYKPTANTLELFEKQLAVGYSGEDMSKAISNLYSTKNTWHKKNQYVEATPDFLLTGDRMNKFLNAKY